MKRARKALQVALALALTLAAGGCWDGREMDELALVIAGGLDLTDDGQVEVTLQVALPLAIPGGWQGGGKSQKPVMVVSAKGAGKNAQELIGELQRRMSREIFFGHRSVLVIGENYARRGIDQTMDAMLRMTDSRYNCFILTSRGATAREILEAPYQMEIIPAIGIRNMQISKVGFRQRVDQFLEDFASGGKMPVSGAIRLIRNDGESSFTIDEIAAYRLNKLVGYVPQSKVDVFKLLSGQMDGIKLLVQVEPPGKMTKGQLSLDLLSVSHKTRSAVKDGKPRFEVRVRARGRMVANDTSLDMSKSGNLTRVEREASSELREKIESTIAMTQGEFKSDVLGFGNVLHAQHPNEWKKLKDEWTELYPGATFTVGVELTIERIERTTKPGHMPG